VNARFFRNALISTVVAGVMTLGCDGQRSCPSDFSCAELVKLTCGETGQCSSAQSCTAAKRLEADGDPGACESAWCGVGEAYVECE
jgi:hypothetical protein